MTDTTKPMSFMAACRDFFGMKAGQSALQFGQELKELTPKDREDLTGMLVAKGYSILAPAA